MISRGAARLQSPSLDRSQIFREFVSDAGSGSEILRLRRTIWREEFKDSLFQLSFILNLALKQTRSVCLRAF